MSFNIGKYTTKGLEFINEVAVRTGNPEDNNKAARVLKAVLHALRNRLSTEESLQLISQLPLLIKGMYVDGWKPAKNQERIKHLEDFIDDVIKEDGIAGTTDFPTTRSAQKTITGVFLVLKSHVSPGEINDILAALPKELKQLWDEPILYADPYNERD